MYVLHVPLNNNAAVAQHRFTKATSLSHRSFLMATAHVCLNNTKKENDGR